MAEASAAPARIDVVNHRHMAQWLPLRHALWPDTSRAEHASEAAALLRAKDQLALLATVDGEPAGFAEAALRRSYVNGCDTLPGEPVAFLEGIYVASAWRRRGIARALCDHVADWARALGVTELASDALIDNHDSHAMHRALGFAETQRVVFFRRTLK
jgi:aminoglycoside 6'-N-acetyltransferase I